MHFSPRANLRTHLPNTQPSPGSQSLAETQATHSAGGDAHGHSVGDRGVITDGFPGLNDGLMDGDVDFEGSGLFDGLELGVIELDTLGVGEFE